MITVNAYHWFNFYLLFKNIQVQSAANINDIIELVAVQCAAWVWQNRMNLQGLHCGAK